MNVILEDCEERIFDTEEGVEVIPLGLYIIRGDNLCVSRACFGVGAAACLL